LANVDGLNQVVVVTLVARYPCVEIRDAVAFEIVSFVRTRSAIVARATGTFVNIWNDIPRDRVLLYNAIWQRSRIRHEQIRMQTYPYTRPHSFAHANAYLLKRSLTSCCVS